MILLKNFTKNWIDPISNNLFWKEIKCHLWFNSDSEMMHFIHSHQEIKNYKPSNHNKDNYEKWSDFCTMKLKFEKE